jgi:hypothetical protein
MRDSDPTPISRVQKDPDQTENQISRRSMTRNATQPPDGTLTKVLTSHNGGVPASDISLDRKAFLKTASTFVQQVIPPEISEC